MVIWSSLPLLSILRISQHLIRFAGGTAVLRVVFFQAVNKVIQISESFLTTEFNRANICGVVRRVKQARLALNRVATLWYGAAFSQHLRSFIVSDVRPKEHFSVRASAFICCCVGIRLTLRPIDSVGLFQACSVCPSCSTQRWVIMPRMLKASVIVKWGATDGSRASSAWDSWHCGCALKDFWCQARNFRFIYISSTAPG